MSRKLFEEDPWWNEKRPRTRVEAWLDLIYLASWRPRRFAIGHEITELQRGEFIASLRFLAERWRWGKTAVSSFLGCAEKLGRIARQRDGQGGTVYLLVNYDHYQSPEPEGRTPDKTERRTPRGHLADKTEAVKQEIPTKATWLTPFSDAWKAKCGNPPFGRLAKELAPLVKELGEPEALTRWSRYLAQTEPRYCAPARFVAIHAAYAGPRIVEMTDDYGRMVPHQQNDAGEWVPVIKVSA